MSLVTRWWWLRHAPVTSDGGRIYGQTDIECDVSDRAAFEALASRLPRDAVWVVSHLKRTHMTARAICEAGIEVPEPIVEPALAEQHFGAWQGRLRSELYAEHPNRRDFWLAPAHLVPPGGESFVAVISRVDKAIRRLTEAHAGRDIVAVAHGGTIRAALAVALKLAPEMALAFSTDNLALTRIDHMASPRLDRGEAWRVSAVNLPPR